MPVPRRPRANPVTVAGTSLRRSYTAPRPETPIRPGDIVIWKKRQWDVAGLRAIRPAESDGYRPRELMLERIAREDGKRKKVTREWAPEHACVLVGHQVLLPGMPEPPPPPETEKRGGAAGG